MVHLIRGQVVKGLVKAVPVVELEPLPEALAQVGAVGKGSEVEIVVLERPPQPLDEDVVLNAPATVHADGDAVVLEQVREDLAGELRSLVGVEDLRGSIAPDSLLDGFCAKVGLHGVGYLPGEDLAAVPVHDGHQIHEPSFHGDVGYVGRPHLVRAVDGKASEQVRIDLVLRVRSAGLGLGIGHKGGKTIC